jgi:hypothetical protein
LGIRDSRARIDWRWSGNPRANDDAWCITDAYRWYGGTVADSVHFAYIAGVHAGPFCKFHSHARYNGDGDYSTDGRA